MDKKAIELLEDIKKLLILQLVKGFKVSSDEVGEVLGVSGRTVRIVATASKKPRKSKEGKK